MYSTKKSSKSSGLSGLEYIPKMAGADSSRYQTSSRSLLEKRNTRRQMHPTRGALKNVFSKSSELFLVDSYRKMLPRWNLFLQSVRQTHNFVNNEVQSSMHVLSELCRKVDKE